MARAFNRYGPLLLFAIGFWLLWCRFAAADELPPNTVSIGATTVTQRRDQLLLDKLRIEAHVDEQTRRCEQQRAEAQGQLDDIARALIVNEGEMDAYTRIQAMVLPKVVRDGTGGR